MGNVSEEGAPWMVMQVVHAVGREKAQECNKAWSLAAVPRPGLRLIGAHSVVLPGEASVSDAADSRLFVCCFSRMDGCGKKGGGWQRQLLRCNEKVLCFTDEVYQKREET
jgi:hypothetical protein